MPPRRIRWLAVLLAVIAAADVVGLVVRHGDEQHRAGAPLRLAVAPHVTMPNALPEPRTLTRFGRTFTISRVRPEGAVHDPAHPAVVDILAADAASGATVSCIRQVRPSARVVAQTSTYVVVATYAYQLPPKTGPCEYFSALQPNDARVAIRLHRPLGARTLWDVESGHAIGVITRSDPPVATYLPAGYSSRPRNRGLPSNTLPFDLRLPVLTRYYYGGAGSLYLQVWSSSYWIPAVHVSAVTTVRGHRATLTTDYGRCVSWENSPGRVYQVCSGKKNSSLSSAELLRVARSTR